MPFQKGNKLGHRGKGHYHRVRAILLEEHEDPIFVLQELMQSKKENFRLQAARELMPYYYAKLQPIDIPNENPFDRMTKEEKIKALKDTLARVEMEDDNRPGSNTSILEISSKKTD